MRLKYYISLLILLVALRTNAQTADTVIKSNTIEIEQPYQPEIKQNPKPLFRPTLPPADNSHPTFNYDVPQQTLFYTYNSTPLRPLALGKDSSYNTYQDYLKLGGGNLSTFYLDFGEHGYGNNASNNTAEHSVQIHSIYQSGSIANQKSWLTNAQADGMISKDNNFWHLSVGILRNQFYYYGYDHAIYDYSAAQVSQVFTGVTASLDLTRKTNASIQYQPKITANFYGDTYKANESGVNILLPFSYNLDTETQIKLNLNGIITRYYVNLQNHYNNVFQFSPGIVYNKEQITAHAYISPTIGQNGSYFLPDLLVSYRLPADLTSLSAGLQSLIRQNTFEQLSTENPYMFDVYEMRQTRSTEAFANAQTNIGHHIMLSGRLSWWQYMDLPVFINNTGDQKQFNIVYEDKLNAISFSAAGRYQVSNIFGAGLNATFFSFSNGNLQQVWHVPTRRIKADVTFHPTHELALSAYLNLLGGINALDLNNNAVVLNNVFDLGANAEYSFATRLSVFVQLGNLLNNQNERWLGYNAYGFNVYGGIRLKF